MAMTLPRLTDDALRAGILDMCAIAIEMLQLTRNAFKQSSTAAMEQLAGLGHDLHLKDKRLTAHVAMQLREAPWVLGSAEHLAFVPAALERIGDQVESLARCVQAIHRDSIQFSERATTEVMALFNRGADLLTQLADVIRTHDRTPLARIHEAGQAFQALCDEAMLDHQERVIRGTCTPRASSVYLAMLDFSREIERYVRRMAAAVEKALPAP
jgi:Na+/phosphate symporter